ncbi:pimeloyl-ACP methyl ester carboxylesterase [Rhizobium sp. BK313]|uniref:alpha/beta fold hydrolase n=1 Tax=Rhizobium sp. BK313 TaxID=2587081 RepID=UPI0010D4F15F|nr:alpha/beta hydrolase [Rhizobium sp. BK313]MBB3459388.1 pimeloyl-ACP methyl ester carboxylesterase [Rhizobium sp. BK313]
MKLIFKIAAALGLIFCSAEAKAATLGTHYDVTGGGGVKLSAYSWGNQNGPAILFIHGVEQSHLIWDHQYDSALAKEFRIVALDLRGQGESEKPADVAAYNTSALYADDIAAVINTLGLKKPVAVAWSAGGFVLCDYLRKYGDGDLSGINFVAVSTKRGVPGAEKLKGAGSSTGNSAAGLHSERAEDEIDSTMAFVKSMAYKPLPPEEFTRIVALNMMTPPNIRAILSVRPVDNGDVLAKIRVPVMLSYGLKDVVINPDTAGHYVASAIPAANLNYYEDAGHLLFIDQADRYNADLREFVFKASNKQP